MDAFGGKLVFEQKAVGKANLYTFFTHSFTEDLHRIFCEFYLC